MSPSITITQSVNVLQWLAFRNDGRYSAADYVKTASEKITKALSADAVWNPFERKELIERRRYFVVRILQGISNGLAYMHDHDRLHQSLGPASVVLKYAVYAICWIMYRVSLCYVNEKSLSCVR